ncbi:MAG TPA: HAD-IIIA family hydrolase [Methylomirabilota bacterium]
MSRRAVFLDRDGVLVDTIVRDHRAYAPVTLDDFRVSAGAREAVQRLRGAGLLPIVFTNQPEVGRGVIAESTLARMHERLRSTVPVEDIFVCVHADDGLCECRKPKPGMLREAAAKWAVDLGRSFVVGDRWRDIDAGRAVGSYTILLERPYSECGVADARVTDLGAAVDVVLARLKEQAAWSS